MFFSNKKNKQIEELYRQLKEKDEIIEKQNLRLMTNQIRPHFIFNSLLAIKQLCIEDPDKAADAVQHFATYLRSNLDAMTTEGLVPFKKELDNIREYVALEQADPASKFRIEYDIQYKDFLLPLLTVQPIVENAIRHGISSKGVKGLVTISSMREDNNVSIVVADNGDGYISETKQQGKHRSIGIQNVKERIEKLCGGTLSIANTGHGTIVRITVPLESARTGNEINEEDDVFEDN